MSAIALLGFRDIVSSEGELWSGPFESEPLPEAPTNALLFDRCPDQPETVTRLRVYLNKILTRGGRLLLFLGPAVGVGMGRGLGSWVQNRLGIWFTQEGPWDLQAEDQALASYFQDQVAYATVESSQPLAHLATLANAIVMGGGPRKPAAIRFRKNHTDVFVVPVRSAHDAEYQARRFIDLIPPAEDYPAYLDELEIGKEAAVREEISRLEAQIDELRSELEQARRAKRILYLTAFDLELEVVRFLDEDLGIRGRHIPGNVEDLRLVNDDSADWCIGEVKASGTGNVARADLGLLDIHRKEANLPDDFPALLVVNTFHGRRNLAQRDQPVGPNEIKRGFEDHILIVRTLDLIRLKQLAIANRPATDKFVGEIRDGGGWFEVNSEFGVLVHTP